MSALVTVVAWAALAGWLVAGVLLVLAHRRLESLERAHTARKWDDIVLRAELGALRRQRLPPAGPAGPADRSTAARGGRGHPVRRAREVPPGATAWRRAHRRPAGRRRRAT